MNFKITVETNDLAGVEAIVNQLHALEKQGAQTEKKLTASTAEVIQTTTEQIYPSVQQQPTYTTFEPEPAPVTPPVQNQPVQQMPATPPVQQQQVTQATQQTPVPIMPIATKQYTMQELSLATRPIVEAGRQQEVIDYLHSFKKADGTPVQTIMDLPVEQYGIFAQGLRQMGGKI